MYNPISSYKRKKFIINRIADIIDLGDEMYKQIRRKPLWEKYTAQELNTLRIAQEISREMDANLFMLNYESKKYRAKKPVFITEKKLKNKLNKLENIIYTVELNEDPISFSSFSL